LVKSGETGTLVAPGNPAELITGIRQVLADPNRAQGMAKEGQRIIDKEFTWNAVANDYQRLYLDLLGKPARNHSPDS